MTNIGDGSVQLKIDSLERNQIKCKKMLSYLKFIFQDSNKLSKQETEVMLNVKIEYLLFVICCYYLSVFFSNIIYPSLGLEFRPVECKTTSF